MKVNGVTIDEFNHEIDAEKDLVEVDGKVVKLVYEKVYYILNKPRGYLTTLSDPFNRKTVLDLIRDKVKEHVFPVGRLDKDSEGLLILTNDGELANRIMHPRYGVLKKYVVKVKGNLSRDDITRLRKGVEIGDGYISSFDLVKVMDVKDGITTVLVGLKEGKKRQIRKMFSKLNKDVLRLIRISIGPLKMGNLKSGEIRRLREREVKELKRHLGLVEGDERRNKNEGGPRWSSS